MLRNILLGLLILPTVLIGQTLIFSEDFETGIPESWTLIDNDGRTVHSSISNFQAPWISVTDPSDATNSVAGSASFFEPTGRASRWLITPEITVGEYGNILYWRTMSHDPSFPDWFMVLVSTTGTEITDFTDTLFRIVNEYPEWTERSVNLSDSGYNDTPIHIAFVNNTNNGFKLYLDDVRIEIEDPVSIKDYEAELFVIYPNPTSTTLKISTKSTYHSYRIFDASGKLILFENKPLLSIDVTPLEKGMYFIQLDSESGSTTQRFIKE